MTMHRNAFLASLAASALFLPVSTRSLTGEEKTPASETPAPVTFTTQEDHRNMMEQLGITRLRPGPNGNESAPNHANYDEALANPYPNLPDALTLKSGNKVTSGAIWWTQRRPEIVEDFDREVLGRVPRTVPNVAWRVSRTEHFDVGGSPVV